MKALLVEAKYIHSHCIYKNKTKNETALEQNIIAS